MQTLNLTLNEERNVTLTAYIQQVSPEDWGMTKRPAIIILPGGGYDYCSRREADPVAFPYLQVGYQVFILTYSVNVHKAWPNPLNDYDQAFEVIKEHADEWHVDTDRIAVIGFSAGGHLAACTATMAQNRPRACILGYPVIDEPTTHTYNKNAPVPTEFVDDKTSPCFVFASTNDGLVPIANSVSFIDALAKNKIPFESHFYAFGNHGFSTGESCVNNRRWICTRTPNWVKDSVEWLKDMMGDFKQGVLCDRDWW
ncbi:MAG: alpha/beta hydrolase [Oscillospiraceae bacterium]|nr:alpha/beta hydrolase [Oscillospiraceae bacterium]